MMRDPDIQEVGRMWQNYQVKVNQGYARSWLVKDPNGIDQRLSSPLKCSPRVWTLLSKDKSHMAAELSFSLRFKRAGTYVEWENTCPRICHTEM
jgi:hypothetical protein